MKRTPQLIASALIACALAVHLHRLNNPALPQIASDFQRKLHSSDLPTLDRELLLSLTADPYAWNSGLVDSLVGIWCLKHVVWHDNYSTTQGSARRVFVFDAFLRPVADMPIPPLVVITDSELNLVNWRVVSHFSRGFQTAHLSCEEDGLILTIRTLANWFGGTYTCQYKLNDIIIEEHTPASTEKWNDACFALELGTDPTSLEEPLGAVRSQGHGRQLWEPAPGTTYDKH